MLRLSLIACALVVCGCKGKAPAKQTQAGSGSAKSAEGADPLGDIAMLAPVDGAGPKAAPEMAAQVTIDAKGALALTPSQPTSLPKLVADLKLPALARRQAPAIAEEGGGDSASATDADKQFARLGHPATGSGVPVPAPRLTTAFALAHPYDVDAGVLVRASPQAPASTLVDVLALTGGFIAVKRGDVLGALPFAFDRQSPPDISPAKSWLEMQLGKPSRAVLVPGAPLPLDANKLEDIVKSSGQAALDILVAPDSTVGDLVHAIELARAAGITAIALGRAPDPGTIQDASRMPRGPRVVAWDFFFQGMDKTDPAPFRKALDDALLPIHDCYAKLLAKSKDLGGTAHVEMMLAPSGKVGELQTIGVDKAIGACAGDALGKATFPAVAQPIKLTAQLAFLPR